MLLALEPLCLPPPPLQPLPPASWPHPGDLSALCTGDRGDRRNWRQDFLLESQRSDYVWEKAQALWELTTATYSTQGPLILTQPPCPVSPQSSRAREQSLKLGTVGLEEGVGGALPFWSSQAEEGNTALPVK